MEGEGKQEVVVLLGGMEGIWNGKKYGCVKRLSRSSLVRKLHPWSPTSEAHDPDILNELRKIAKNSPLYINTLGVCFVEELIVSIREFVV